MSDAAVPSRAPAPAPAPPIQIGPPEIDALATPFRPFRYEVPDGLGIAGRIYGELDDAPLPLLCLPGLTRNGRDFEPVAAFLAGRRPVVTLDFRGRGQSDRDPYPDRYSPLIEAQDVIVGLAALGLPQVALLGTSRGGIVGMILAALRPWLLKAAILNDVGAVLERDGLLRIKDYVGVGPAPADWTEAEAAVARLGGGQFPDLDRAAMARMARRLYREADGRPVPDYDPALSRGLDELTPESPLPDLWAPFEALKDVPVLVIRGALSDILSEMTVTAMAARHAGLEAHTVPRQGHAPLLEDEATLARIGAFLDRAEHRGTSAG
ncbi:alpha/beta fold hydrolase [Prosthecomicrobium sp. N25]|uniref:alpha/beta fold hydrolase n=1 Tax=Prosthecomicrobium sp. N25 TaxID=3129254 RepID=UPI003076D8E4